MSHGLSVGGGADALAEKPLSFWRNEADGVYEVGEGLFVLCLSCTVLALQCFHGSHPERPVHGQTIATCFTRRDRGRCGNDLRPGHSSF